MPLTPSSIIAILVIALGVGFVVVYFWRDHTRRHAMAAVADRAGMQYQREDPALLARASSFRLFTLGRSARVKNVIAGPIADVDVRIFDHQYRTGGGQNSRTHRQTVALFSVPGAGQFPAFELRPENVFHKIGGALGYQDIDFPDHPHFSSRYLLRGPDEERIRRLFQPHIVALFEDRPKPVCVESTGQSVIVYRHHQLVKPSNFMDFLEETFSLFNELTAATEASMQAVDA